MIFVTGAEAVAVDKSFCSMMKFQWLILVDKFGRKILYVSCGEKLSQKCYPWKKKLQVLRPTIRNAVRNTVRGEVIRIFVTEDRGGGIAHSSSWRSGI